MFCNMRKSAMSRLLPALLVTSAAWLAAAPALAHAKEMQCTVNSVHDGDSMRVLCPGERGTLRVRMQQIDAPELEQAYGLHARNLRRLCPVGTTAIIHTQGKDQYDRLLGDVYCDGKNVNQEMVTAGAAWLYDRYVEDKGLYRFQDEAKADRRGLWGGKNPQKPWQWRYEQRNR